MGTPYHHSVSSAKKFGGTPNDYQKLHDWFDASKKFMADYRHRALRHHAEGIFALEYEFGTTIVNSEGKRVPTRLIGEQHVREDLGFIPSLQDWLSNIQPQAWMRRGVDKSVGEAPPVSDPKNLRLAKKENNAH